MQFRTMLGGDGDHESIKLSDDELVKTAHDDISSILNITAPPETVKIYRWKQGIPQFIVGHSATMDKIETELNKQGNLYITGNAYFGISLNDCVKQSYKVVQEL